MYMCTHTTHAHAQHTVPVHRHRHSVSVTRESRTDTQTVHRAHTHTATPTHSIHTAHSHSLAEQSSRKPQHTAHGTQCTQQERTAHSAQDTAHSLGCSVAYSIYSIGECYTCYIVYYTIVLVLHSVLDKKIGMLEHLVFSIWARPGRGLAASSSSSSSNRVKLEIVQISEERRAMLYSTVASDGSYIAL